MKDKMAVFLSLLTQIIILGLFLLFIKNSYVDGINEESDGITTDFKTIPGKIMNHLK